MSNEDIKKKKRNLSEEDELKKWLKSLEDYSPSSWNRLPELDLYMDQVVTFLNRQLNIFSVSDENLLTPSMVNNYVKDDVLPRPEKKKYTKTHLSMLMMICTLKSVLSLPEINTLLNGLTTEKEVYEQYPAFLNIIESSNQEIFNRLKEEINTSEKEKFYLALQLALEANIRHTAASRILKSLKKDNDKK